MYINAWSGTYLGAAVIFGLIEGTTGMRSPQLDIYGQASTGSTLLFHLRQAGANTNAVIDLGTTNPSTLIGSCWQLTNGNLASLPVTTTASGDAAVSYTVPATLLHQHVFAQGIATSGTSTLRTNGVRLSIGGVTP
jgi:hypothetical protein